MLLVAYDDLPWLTPRLHAAVEPATAASPLSAALLDRIIAKAAPDLNMRAYGVALLRVVADIDAALGGHDFDPTVLHALRLDYAANHSTDWLPFLSCSFVFTAVSAVGCFFLWVCSTHRKSRDADGDVEMNADNKHVRMATLRKMLKKNN